MRTGDFYTYQGKEYVVVATGDWGVRLERGHGHSYSVIVIQWTHFFR